ncbi:MAG: HAMP domain-containing histidine kinase [Faecalibacterium sp.]|nr:HAMP domain-containing histidine kinase [Ruminococcus sp.]MCM1392423.1 HAMP domain-containing histidine kinase [Ruminococcus sp.]MCM1486420.1 HAMP domain-containing histidine kinase [Faecalibacterium sp.]
MANQDKKKKDKRRKRRKHNSLMLHNFKNTAILITIAFMLFSVMIISIVAAEWWNQKIEVLTTNAQDIVRTINNYYDNENDIDDRGKWFSRWALNSTLSVMSNATSSDYFITDKQGNVIACKDLIYQGSAEKCEEHSSMKVSEQYMKRALSKGFSDYSTDDVFGFGKFIVSVPINVEESDYAAVFAVEDAITGLFPYIMNVLKVTMIAVGLGLLLSFIFIYFNSKRITTPINEMKEITNHFAKGEFEHRANEQYEDKYLNDFSRSLNKMANELAIEEESRRSFVANVSHELKTPMTTIGGFIDGIIDGTIPKEQEMKYLGIVSNEVKRLSRIVVSMLNLSKIEAGEVSIAPIKYDISAQIFETLLSFEERINEKKIDIVGFENMGSVIINADKDLIQQVIYNLLDNAVKFTPEKGIISVIAENTEDMTCVKIRNTGAGVSKEEISRIFERFYKVDKSRSFDVKGVGLGLYIVKTIINMHDGDITASSIEDEYIEFSFEIPREHEPAETLG